jgi:polysaccharide export outer membrane protein
MKAIFIAISVLFAMACAAQLLLESNAAAAAFRTQQGATPATARVSANVSVEGGNDNDHTAELMIANGDLLEISVFGTDFSCGNDKSGCEARVSALGKITLPLISAVKVAGLTVAQAEQEVAARLSQGGFYNDPQVTITQKEYSTQGISVMGEVQKPGIYPLLGSHTLLQAISAAGGTTVKAGNDVTIIRSNEYQHADISSPTGSSVPLRPGDTIVVSKAGIVYVVGDVRQPTGVVMDNTGLTVLQAIAMAQGTNATASLDKAKLIRYTPEGRNEIAIPLRKILSNKAKDLELQAEDILFVPNSVAKSVTRRGLEAALQAATGVVIYSRY